MDLPYEDRILLLEHTFRVENDLMLAPSDYLVEDISEPRTGQVADGSRVRKDDRLAFTGTVVYEGSSVPAPRDVGILVEVFDGEKMWSDGSLTERRSLLSRSTTLLGNHASILSNPNMFDFHHQHSRSWRRHDWNAWSQPHCK